MRKLSLICLVVLLFSAVALPQVLKGSQPSRRPGGAAGNPEQNREMVRRGFDDTWNKGDMSWFQRAFAPNCVFHEGSKTLTLSDMMQEVRGLRSGAPDLRMTAANITASGDDVSVDWVGHGTNTGQGLWPPTGKSFNERGRSVFHFSGGKIVEVNTSFDLNEMKRKLGVGKK